ncbi:DUF1800 family protein [Colwelliaceae bacterium 6441]
MLNNLKERHSALRFALSFLKKYVTISLLLVTSISALAGSVNLTIKDHYSGQAISQTSVTAYKLDSAGAKSWYKNSTTDDNGLAVFDLAGVENNERYVFAVKAYNNHYSYSQIVASTDDITLSVGQLIITVKDGNLTHQPALSDHSVYINKQNADGKFAYYSGAKTDENGVLRLDLPNINDGAVYQLRSKTSQTFDYKYSELISSNANIEFIVGNVPVKVILINDEDQKVIANTDITIYEKLSSGYLKWRTRKASNEDGEALFDLDGLQTGRQYFAKAKVFNNSYSVSPVIQIAGLHKFIVGNTRFTILNGTKESKPPLINQRVDVYRVASTGTSKHYLSATTNEVGRLYLTLPMGAENDSYYLKTKSTVSEQSKYSERISVAGEHTFVVGNLPVALSLTDGISQSAIAHQRVDVYQIQADGKLKWYTSGETDQNGLVNFDLEGLGIDTNYQFKTKYFNDVYFYSDVIKVTGPVAFQLGNTQITLKNGLEGNNAILPEHTSYLYQVLSDGSYKSRGRYYSDKLGVIRLNLPTLYPTEPYVLKTKSSLGTWYEHSLKQQGLHEFVIGSQPLSVTLLDAKSSTPLSDQTIYVYRINEQGKKTRFTYVKTNELGQVDIDIPDLDDNHPYILSSKVFTNFTSYSQVLTSKGKFNFEIGSINVSLINGAKLTSDTEPSERLANTEMTIYKLVDGKRHWYTRVISDENGLVRFDLADLDKGQTYQFSAKSQVDGSYKYSEIISRKGDHNFIVGNPAVTIRLANYLTNETYPDTKVTAYSIDTEGKKHWYSSRNTDEQGRVFFDLNGIAQGAQYKFSTALFTSGYSYSQVINQAGSIDFLVGALPVLLTDTESNLSLIDKKVTLYQIDEDNKLHWRRSGKTDATGQIVFDDEGFALGHRFVLKADNPFGQAKHYYGPIVTSEGHVNFRLKQGEGQSLDLISPEIAITSPNSDSAIYTGFSVSGSSSDNESIDRIQVSVSVNGQSVFTEQAQLHTNGNWHVAVNGNWLQDGLPVVITATAFDFALNKSSHQIELTLGPDVTPPEITILSHVNNDNVNQTGFTLFGTVIDDGEVGSITISLSDALLGQTVNQQSVSIATDGSWSLPITTNQVSSDQQVSITIEATDLYENVSSKVLLLNTVEVTDNPIQMANRISFGITPLMLAQINAGTDLLNQQIFDQNIDDSELESTFVDFTPQNISELQQYVMYRMIKSKKQLREMMTWFWENHFNTNYNSHRNLAYEFNENNRFRSLALGRFEDLLLASAKSPAMIYYLNNADNVVGAANENYAREVMELHSLGVNGGYNDEDVAELSKIFTGWHEQGDEFYFDESAHDYTDKTFIGQQILGSGVSEGEQAISILASHPSTANYICSKLIVFFVSEQGDSNLQNQCADSFLNSQGNIPTVLQTIFQSESFALEQVIRRKVKTPLELVVSTARTFGTDINIDGIDDSMPRLGMRLFVYPVPTGYSEEGADWLNTNALLQRVQFVNRVVWQSANGITVDGLSLIHRQNLQTPEAIISYFVNLAYAGEVTSEEYSTFLAILNDKGDFDINGNEASHKIKRLLGTMLSGPAFQMQ